jgi:hypothetical protein
MTPRAHPTQPSAVQIRQGSGSASRRSAWPCASQFVTAGNRQALDGGGLIVAEADWPSPTGLSPDREVPSMTVTTTALVPLQPAFSDAERLALAGFLAGYRGLTREAYALLCRSRHNRA